MTNIANPHALEHAPYHSLEQFRPALIDTYLETHADSDVIVHEKIHGSNVQFTARGNPLIGWTFKIGSRRRWIEKDEKFNNIHKIFDDIKPRFERMVNMVFCSPPDGSCNTDVVGDTPEIVTIRVFGEVFGGKYGHTTDKGAIKTQKEPNYGAYNDVAFFDIVYNGIPLPVLEAHGYIQWANLRTVPKIYMGPLKAFLQTFDVNQFKSVVSSQFYGLDFIDVPNSTEGVTIRTVDLEATGNKSTVLKYKQTWALENHRVIQPKTDGLPNNTPAQVVACLDMLNEQRLVSYHSKNTTADITDMRMIVENVKEIVKDTMKDVIEEFPMMDPDTVNMVRKRLSKKAFTMFKKYIGDL